ncbi:XRE family transcriptional regulator [Methylocystis parvus]|uniref:XRE family transcriptional regulator n=1 Tax=Methylocystis parvus TaxID=134 RepID=UPI003C74D9E0
MGNNLKSLRKAAKLTQPQAAAAMGLSKGGYVKLEDGDRRLTADYISRAAKAFGVRESEVFQDIPDAIPVMGKIGAGAEIEPDFEQVAEGGLYEIQSDLPLPDGMIGFEVEGNSMWPRYDAGDIVICSAAGVAPESLAPGAEAAIKTADGRRFLKRVRRSGRGYTLESHNAGPIENVQIDWASEVVTVVRGSQWRRLNGKFAM